MDFDIPLAYDCPNRNVGKRMGIMSDKKSVSINTEEVSQDTESGETQVASQGRRSFVRKILAAGGFLAGAGAVSNGLVSSALAQNGPLGSTTTGSPTTTFQPTTRPPERVPAPVPALTVAGLAALTAAIGGTAAVAEMKRRGQKVPEQEDGEK